MEVAEIGPGLWRWTAAHPDWTAQADWPEAVGCVYYEGPGAVVLIDPLVPADEEERFWRALDRDVERLGLPVAVLLTVGWHERSARTLAARYGAGVWRRGEGAPPPAGVEPIDVAAAEETVFWLPEHRALVPGDVLMEDAGLRLCPGSWLPEGRTLDELRAALAPALALPVELVLVSHGTPVLDGAAEALSRALAAP
jgi:glyoxylase-like metal-dependent hydrolase (beta-lactamase superfamily II)